MNLLTMGTFDLIHQGHVALLRECRVLADAAAAGSRLTVAVNTDDFVERFKFREPVMRYAERAAVVAAIRGVDEVVPNDGLDQPGLIERVGPHVIAVGVDWAGRDYHAQLGITPEWLARRGISLRYVEHEHSARISSTLLRNRMGKP